MLYRKFGKTGLDVSILGFGCMRLPLIEGTDGDVDIEESIRMIRYGIDNGINYIDTAWPYHKGESEIITGKALADGYRERVYLATKMPSWLVQSREDMDTYLDKQLHKLGTDYIDFYLLHTLNTKYWEGLKNNDVFDFIAGAKASGRIRHIGFSFHDELPLFRDIIDSYDWDFCQIQYNFMDIEYQAGREGLDYAADKGMGIVIMEPLRGGSMTRNIPDSIMDIWKSSDDVSTPVDTALRFIWDHPGVSTVLSGMSEMSHVVSNIKSAEKGTAGNLSEIEHSVLDKVRTAYRERLIANCTNCRYCMPCPSGVDIPVCLSYLNNPSMYGTMQPFQTSYNMYFDPKKKATNCIECGQCEEACPQNIAIMDCLKQLTEVMSRD